ncbi:hypothetical protein [Acinetobacter indicus]|uniref:hypothetical protein n=1 Tax=Acinetobacter indicus TaxID=756892 RepID=UPI0014446F2F|nr:hypothetical protein [Acinetobacter indicus]
MKRAFSHFLLPFGLLTSALLLVGCDQPSAPVSEADPDTEITSQQQSPAPQADLKSGNMFYIVRDVADMQLKAGEYVEQLRQTQTELQQAVNSQDHQQLQSAASKLQQQLQGFNSALNSLNLKSQEIDNIRQNILQANEQVLASPFLNGQIDLSKVDFAKIQQQMGTVQSEMVKLASILLQSENAENTESANTDTENQAVTES